MIGNKKGLTLIEIIVSVAIFGILVVLFMSIFANSHRLIRNAGNSSKDLINNQKNIETSMAQFLSSGTVEVDIDGMFLSKSLPNGTYDMVMVSDGTFSSLVSPSEIAVSNQATLTSVSTTFGSLVPVFDQYTFTYHVYNAIIQNETKLKNSMAYTLFDPTSSVDLDGVKTDPIAEWRLDITVTATDSSEKVYVIYFHEGGP